MHISFRWWIVISIFVVVVVVVPMYLYVGLCTRVQAKEVRVLGISGSGVTDNWQSPGVGAGDQTLVLSKPEDSPTSLCIVF